MYSLLQTACDCFNRTTDGNRASLGLHNSSLLKDDRGTTRLESAVNFVRTAIYCIASVARHITAKYQSLFCLLIQITAHQMADFRSSAYTYL